jgi:hypothetical protein
MSKYNAAFYTRITDAVTNALLADGMVVALARSEGLGGMTRFVEVRNNKAFDEYDAGVWLHLYDKRMTKGTCALETQARTGSEAGERAFAQRVADALTRAGIAVTDVRFNVVQWNGVVRFEARNM